jgi:hypothetical protein
MLVHLYIAYDFLYATSGYNGDCMVAKLNMYYLVPYRKCLPNPGLSYHSVTWGLQSEMRVCQSLPLQCWVSFLL